MRISTPLVYQSALEGMLFQQAKLSRTQDQIASGKKMLHPSDDPYGASRVLDLTQYMLTTTQYSSNADYASNALSLEDTSLSTVTEYIQRIRELAIQANNGTQTKESLHDISAEVEKLLEGILSVANTQDSNGEFIFGGYQGNTKPFAATSAGTFAYYGDQGQRLVQIGSSTHLEVGDSGDAVFRFIRRGNGEFETFESPTNVGTGIMDTGTVTGNYVPGYYSIKFIQPLQPAALNALPEYYVTYQPVVYPPQPIPTPFPGPQVIISGSGATYADEDTFLAAVQNGLETGVSYKEGATISFSGIETNILGTPDNGTRPNGTPLAPPVTIVPGDSFNIYPASHQDLLQTVQNFVDALAMPYASDADKAHYHNAVNRVLADLDQALGNIVDHRAKIGARLSTADRSKSVIEALTIQWKSNISQIQDLDYAEAATRLSQQLLGLQASQNSFAKTQSLSLFNYIR